MLRVPYLMSPFTGSCFAQLLTVPKTKVETNGHAKKKLYRWALTMGRAYIRYEDTSIRSPFDDLCMFRGRHNPDSFLSDMYGLGHMFAGSGRMCGTLSAVG